MPIVNGRDGAVGRYHSNYGMKDIYNDYCNKYHARKNIKQGEFSKIFKDYVKEIVDLIIFNNHEWRIPCNIGSIRIKKTKIRFRENSKGGLNKAKLMVDWGATNKLWEENPEMKKKKKVLYYMNKHTDGYKYLFIWKKHVLFLKRGNLMFLYSISMNRAVDRYLAKCIFANPELNYYL